jgi:hypothetical protein
MRRTFFFAVLLLIAFTEFCLAADLDLIGIGASSMGMGKNGIALFDDINTVYLNPAGLSRIKSRQFSSMYTKCLDEVNYIVASGALPLKVGALGISYIGSRISDIPVTVLLADGSLDQDNISFINYSSYILSLSYGLDIGPKEYGLSSGIRFKLFGEDLSKGSANGYDMDLGIRYQPVPWLRMAVMQENLLPSSLGARLNWSTGLKEGIPTKTKAAVGLIFSNLGLEAGLEKQTLLEKYPILCRAGVEWWPVNLIALRIGIDQVPIPGGNDKMADTAGELSAGLGFRYAEFMFDYAYRPFTGYSGNNAHFFSISYLGKSDFSPPEIKYRFVNDEIYRDSNLELGIKVSEPVNYLKAKLPGYNESDLKPGDKGLVLLRFVVPAGLPLGENQLEIEAEDLQGNLVKIPVKFVVLSREPKIELSEPGDRRVKTSEDNITLKGKVIGEKIFINDEIIKTTDKFDVNVKLPKIGLNRIMIKAEGENGKVEEKEILVLRTGREK